jgi:hypothetical protein
MNMIGKCVDMFQLIKFWKLKGLKFLKYQVYNFESENFIIYIICHIMKVLMNLQEETMRKVMPLTKVQWVMKVL